MAKSGGLFCENLITKSKISRDFIERILTSVVQNGDDTYSLRHAKREVWENSVARERLRPRFSKFCARSSFVRSLDVFRDVCDFAIEKASEGENSYA